MKPNSAPSTSLSIEEAVPLENASTVSVHRSRTNVLFNTTGQTRSQMILASMVMGFSLGALSEISSLALIFFFGSTSSHFYLWMLLWSFLNSILCMMVSESMLELAGQEQNTVSCFLYPMEVAFFGTHVITTGSIYVVFAWCLAGSNQIVPSIGLVLLYILVGVCCGMRPWATRNNNNGHDYEMMEQNEQEKDVADTSGSILG